MKPILEKLHDDHINFIKLLTFLEKQLALLEKAEHSDLVSILDAIRYMKEYPDYVHHPLENVIFKYFLEHYTEAHDKFNDLLQEHEEMPSYTEILLNMLKGALADVPQDREELCRYLSKYISIQREHMNREEAYVYPILSSTLNENDWDNINSELVHMQDPLFGGQVEKSYQNLLQQVIG